MTFKEISGFRLVNQQITATNFKAAKDIVGWMGAMQAQDYTMAKWAVGVRLPHCTETSIEAAINKGEILRTHLLRPTWHLVSPSDIYWMLELTAPHIKTSARSRWRQLELTETIFKKSIELIEKALAGGKHLTREELNKELERGKIVTNDQRLAHIMLGAELDKIVCSGASKGKKQTYALLSERVPKTKPFHREEALGMLAKKYFTSHGPATLQDFVWWSGLPSLHAKNALEMVKLNFVSEKINSHTFWRTPASADYKIHQESIYLLPAYDEFIISYKDRSASLLLENHHRTISNNGLFRPVIIMNGQVTGIWNKAIKKDKIIIETHLFKSPTKRLKNLIEKASSLLGDFLNLKTEIIHRSK